MNRKLLQVWRSMQNRCYNENQKSYQHYGARGIVVCDRWLGKEGFDNFLADMGEPKEGESIERIDNNGNYELSNCKWANKKEQANNKRNNVFLTANGITLSQAQWAEKLGCTPSALVLRLRKMSVEDALTKPIPERPNSKLTMEQAIYIRSQYPMRSLKNIADEMGVCKKTIMNIVHNKIFTGKPRGSQCR